MTLLEPQAIPHQKVGTLAQSHTLWSNDGQCTLRYLHYPPLSAATTRTLLQQGYWRAGPHTDWTNITLLLTKSSGLECCANPRTGKPEELYWTEGK